MPPSDERVVSQHTLDWALDEVRPISCVRGNNLSDIDHKANN